MPSLEEEFGPDRMREWETSDRLDVFHYGENATRALGWGFMADARRYDAFAVAAADANPDLPGHR